MESPAAVSSGIEYLIFIELAPSYSYAEKNTMHMLQAREAFRREKLLPRSETETIHVWMSLRLSKGVTFSVCFLLLFRPLFAVVPG